MTRQDQHLTGVERSFDDDELIVSKTDIKGRMTYCNDLFIRLSGFRESELIGQPHSLIRHPHMPRTAFKLLWDHLQDGREVFAYVVNRAKNGDHYWVLAHVAPDLDRTGTVVGYHSNRRTAAAAAREVVEPLYARLRAVETASADPQAGLQAGLAELNAMLAAKGVDYDRFILDL